MNNSIFILYFFTLILVSCSTYNKFDMLYYNQEYQQAYELLKTNSNPNSLSYQERELKVLLFLAIQDTQKYLPMLDNSLLKNTSVQLQTWHNLARAWIRFISAETRTDYQNIINIVPKDPFTDYNAEQLRLIIQNHSLIRLEQYQEAFAYLNTSKITKNSSDLLYLKGSALLELKEFQQASEIFQSLIMISSTPKLQSLAYFYLGNIASQEKKWDQAEKYYFEAWKLNPYQAELNLQLGKLLQKQSYSDLHYRFYRASLRLNENLAESWYRLNI